MARGQGGGRGGPTVRAPVSSSIAWARWIPYAILFGATVIVGAELARPIRSASISFDSAATVLYFQRIVSGQPLEAFVTTTPKPLLTVLFGVLQAITHDWRSLAWLTLLTDGLAVTMTAYLASRLAGPVAAAFVGVALVDNASLLTDVGFAAATPYALAGWALAGLALTGARPRYGLAGLALALASLARVETLIIVGVALVGLAWVAWAPLRWRFGTVPRRAWIVPLVGLTALPVMLIHDQLLAGDPLYWMKVPTVYGAGFLGTLPSAVDVIRTMGGHYWAMGGVVLLAVLGSLRLLEQRRVAVLAGLVALGPGVAAFLVLLAARNANVPVRYLAAVDVAVIFAAGVGIASIAVRASDWPTLRRVSERVRMLGTAILPVGIAALAAVVLSGFYWQQNPALRTSVHDSLRLALDTDQVEPYLSAAPSSSAPADGKPPILVPVPVQPRVSVDLGRSLLEVGPISASRIDIAGGNPSPGQVLFHDRASDGTDPRWADFETTISRTVGPITLVPVYVDAARGIWVIAVR
jgi:hypothetical protein